MHSHPNDNYADGYDQYSGGQFYNRIWLKQEILEMLVLVFELS